MNETLDKETESYLKRLRQHFDVQTLAAQGKEESLEKDDFEPFTLESY